MSIAAAGGNIAVVPVERLELSYAPRPWPFSRARRADIDAHFAALQRDKPALWNGPVLLLHEHEITGRVFRGAFLETDFASFIAWRDWNFPDSDVRNCFAMGALRSADGAFIMGVMGPHTANAGRIYFPAGTPDPADLRGGEVDLAGSVMRELEEETGLQADDVSAAPGWRAVLAGPRIALMRTLRAHQTADELRRRIRAFLAAQPRPELADIHLCRSPDDLVAAMPPFITAFLAQAWS